MWNWREVHKFYLPRESGKIWTCSCRVKGNFTMTNEFKYGQTWKIWPSPLSLSLYNPFKMFETNMLENFLWMSSAIAKLEVYTNSSLKNQLICRNFGTILLELKSHKTYFAKKPLGGCFQCFMHLLFISFLIL